MIVGFPLFGQGKSSWNPLEYTSLPSLPEFNKEKFSLPDLMGEWENGPICIHFSVNTRAKKKLNSKR